MKTKGNYKIENFIILDTPIFNGNLEPHIYKGSIIGLPKTKLSANKEFITVETTWDKFGRCPNWSREDCFIDIKYILRKHKLNKLLYER